MPNAYQNIRFENPVMTLAIVIWSLYIGFVIAGGLSVYHKCYLGDVIRALVKKGAKDKESAVKVDEIGIKMGYLRRRNVLSGGLLSKYVIVANPEESLVKKAPLSPFLSAMSKFFGGSGERRTEYDAEIARIYLLEEKRVQAEVRYSKKGTSYWMFLVSAVVFLALAVGLTFAIPYLLDLLDEAITLYKNLFPSKYA